MLSSLQHAALHVIEQPAGRRHQDIHAVAQRFILLAVADAAEHDHRAQVGEAGKVVDGGFDLGRQLAGRLEDEHAGLAVLPRAEKGSAARTPRSCPCRSAPCR